MRRADEREGGCNQETPWPPARNPPSFFHSATYCARPNAPGTRVRIDYGVGFFSDESLVGAGVEPAAMCALSLLRRLSLMLDPLLIPFVLFAAGGATDPPAVDESVAFVLSLFAHAARKASETTIAMRFMYSSPRDNEP
jgi:hypothetical protein